MSALNVRILLDRAGHIGAALTLILACTIVLSMPATAETPTLRLHSTDMAPSTIYIGDAYAEEIHDIVMLQITIDTTHSEGVILNSITIHRTGTASGADVESVSLYEDSDHDGELDYGTDEQLSTANFDLGITELSVLLNITPINPLTLLITLNISSEATSGGTIGIDIPNEDNITTKESATIEFDFPLCSKNSTILLDTDGDLNADETDPDDDNDGYTDEIEDSCGTDTKDSNSVPIDTDKDYEPDSIDTDDDNDGVPDEYDDFPFDASRQRDYTVVYVLAAIAAVLIIAMILLKLKSRRARGLGRKAFPEEESEDEFDMDIEDEELEDELDMDIEDEELEAEEEEGIDEDLLD